MASGRGEPLKPIKGPSPSSEFGVGSIHSDAVQDYAGILELEDECGEWTCASGDGGGLRDCGCGGWRLDRGGGVGGADTRTCAGVAGFTRTP